MCLCKGMFVQDEAVGSVCFHIKALCLTVIFMYTYIKNMYKFDAYLSSVCYLPTGKESSLGLAI